MSSELFSVKGQIVIVTGAASGIGYAMAEAMAESGAHVAMIDRNADLLHQGVNKMTGRGLLATAIACDVCDEGAMAVAFKSTFDKHGRLDTVFANAGIGAPGGGYQDRDGNPREDFAIENYEMWRWKQTLDVNLTGAFITIKEAARYMRPQRAGQIIVTTSMTSLVNPPFVGAPYPAGKAALSHFMRGVAVELAPHGIRVNAIAPGVIATSVAGPAMLEPEVQRRSGKGVPLGRVGQPAELKGLAIFLASSASSYMVGAEIVIDGGLTLWRMDKR